MPSSIVYFLYNSWWISPSDGYFLYTGDETHIPQLAIFVWLLQGTLQNINCFVGQYVVYYCTANSHLVGLYIYNTTLISVICFLLYTDNVMSTILPMPSITVGESHQVMGTFYILVVLLILMTLFAIIGWGFCFLQWRIKKCHKSNNLDELSHFDRTYDDKG